MTTGSRGETKSLTEKKKKKKSSETSITHSGLLLGDNQSQLKKNMESKNVIKNNECCTSDNHDHGSDVCNGEEMKGEIQRGSKYMIPFPYHCGNVRISYQSEENAEDGVHNDVDGSYYYSDDFDDDFDEYLVLSLTRR
jgi:hypothetical protein